MYIYIYQNTGLYMQHVVIPIKICFGGSLAGFFWRLCDRHKTEHTYEHAHITPLETGMPGVSILCPVSHMPSCRTSRFACVGFQLLCRARRVVSQRLVSRVSRHGKPSGISLMQQQSGRTLHAASGQIVLSAVTAVSALSGQNAMSAVSCQPCLVHAPVHRVVFWREVRFRPVSCRTAAFL